MISAHQFRSVWRTSLDEPGYAVLPGIADSFELRRAMLAIRDACGEFLGVPFVAERFGRFDQQVTTKFHRDGAPTASLLVLGYEPSEVPSRLFIADAYRAARDANLGVNAFLAANNPMFPLGEAKLLPYVRELTFPNELGAIVLINNSLFADDEPTPTFGLLHKGEIPMPNPAAMRVINSMGLTPLASVAADATRFVTRNDLD